MSNNQLAGLFNLEGKTALITGSTRGIGFALACGLGQAGAHVLINGRSADAIQKVVDQLNSRSIAATGLVADVTQQDEISAQIDRYEAHTGPIDILVNNAGMQHRAPLESFEADVFDQMIAVNLKAAFYTAKALSAFMIARQHGRIINIASVKTVLIPIGSVHIVVSLAVLFMVDHVHCASIRFNGKTMAVVGYEVDQVVSLQIHKRRVLSYNVAKLFFLYFIDILGI